jgi:hypothetical protein
LWGPIFTLFIKRENERFMENQLAEFEWYRDVHGEQLWSLIMQPKTSFPELPQLMTAEEAADTLRKTPQAMREAMCRSRAPWAVWLRDQRVRMGRRYYFRTADVLAVAEKGDSVATAPRVIPLGLQPRPNRNLG